MKRFLKYLKPFLFTSSMLALSAAFFNCSAIGTAVNMSGDSSSNLSSGAPLNSSATGVIAVASGQSGAIQVLEDRTYTITAIGGTAPYAISGLPTGATFNSTTGTLTGVGPTYGTSATFSISSAKGSFGPFAFQVVGNPLKQYQWHLVNTGQTAFATTAGTAGQDMNLKTTIASGITGAGVKIAFSDTGAYVTHEALAPNLLSGQSRNYFNKYASTGTWIGDPTPSTATSDYAHGTAVASLAIEKGWNNVGGRGLAPDASYASFLFIQAQDQLQSEGYYTQGLYSQFQGNFDIFNYSWGDSQCTMTEYPQSMVDTLAAAVTSQRGGLGSILLQAGGNSFTESLSDCDSSASSSAIAFGNANMSEIQTNPYVLSIAAVNASGVSSSYGTPGSNLWVSSLGGEFGLNKNVSGAASDTMPALIAADFPGCSIGLKTQDAADSNFDSCQSPNTAGKYTSTMNGTSGATPLASAAVALMLQANPKLTWRDVKYILAKTADKIDPNVNPSTHPNADLNLAGHQYELPWVTNAAGFHFMNYYGFGRINVDNAVAMAKTYVAGTLGTFRTSNWADNTSGVNYAIPDNSAAGHVFAKTTSQSMTLEAVQVQVSISNCIGDMGLELISPSGTKSILLNINSEISDGAMSNHIFMSNAFYGEQSAGTWTFKVIDGHAGCTGALTSFAMNFSGH